MEDLKKLEKVQKTMELMQSHGIFVNSSNQNPNSFRFLANFTLFLIQPYYELDIDAKCKLISEHMEKVSDSFIEEALQLVSDEDTKGTDPLHSDDNEYLNSSANDFQEAAVVGLDAMQRANSTLEDFCRSYFMFHKMDVHQPRSIFNCLPILSFTESYIYQLDGLNEQLLQLPTYGVSFENRECDMVSKAEQSWYIKSLKMLTNDPFRPLLLLLERQGLLTQCLREEFSCGKEYWALERKLCSSLLSKEEITIDDVMRAVHLKSFDYRVLNLLLYNLRAEKVNDMHFEFLTMSEFLVEVSDDLFDYEDDVLENNFNILRMFVRIYGASDAPMMLAKCITEAEEKYENLLKSLDPDLSTSYLKRCEEATKEGGKISGPSLGTWNIPAIIEDEDAYRREILSAKL